jgi:anaerobic selenocysteine-containing dehydrogenase
LRQLVRAGRTRRLTDRILQSHGASITFQVIEAASEPDETAAMRRTTADGAHEVLGACALDCPDTCSWVVTVKDGRAVKLQGDPQHPFTRGVLCNKVNGYVAYTQSPDRLLHPMRRRGPKGRGEFERICWDAALDAIAERFNGVIREFGAEAIWPYSAPAAWDSSRECTARAAGSGTRWAPRNTG